MSSKPSQDVDANKKIKGCKRHIAADVLGLLLAVMVTARRSRTRPPVGNS